MFARYYGRRAPATETASPSSLPTSPDQWAVTSNGTSARQNQRRNNLSSSDEANNAMEEASKMLEELRTILDKLDHLLVKIAPPPITTQLLSECPPQPQLPLMSQSQTEEEDKGAVDVEHDDSNCVGDSAKNIGNAAVLVDNNQEGGIDNADDDESDCSVRTDSDNYDTTKNNCSVKNEDGNDHVDEDPSPRLSTSTASSAAAAAPTPPTSSPSPSTTTTIPTRSAKFLDIHPTDINEIIECLRRSAEIVALSERRAGALDEELAAVLESSRLEEEQRRKDRRKKREINDNDVSNTDDADGEVHVPNKLDNANDDDMKSKSQSTTSNDEFKRQNEELNGENEDSHDDEKKAEEDNYVDDAARILPHHIASFELFCERNVLSKIVGLVTGSAFDNPSYTPTSHPLPRPQPQSRQQNLPSSPPPSTQPPPPLPPPLLLPPLSIATQAVQSASILIQNVCRATSLYLLLSNNVVNDLIGLPLDAYKRACAAEEADADEKDVAAAAAATASVTTAGRKWGQQLHHLQQQQQQHQLLKQQQRRRRRHRQQRHQQEISELTTHFVSFLKGLAMRVNAETLQFFLSYPTTTSTTSATTKDEKDRSGEKEVEFPLYARALEFCSPLVLMPTSSSTPSSSSGEEEDGNRHLDDPFVRITAMSVCMNILRLVTYHHIDVDTDNESVVDDNDLTDDDVDEEAANACSDDDTGNSEVEDDECRRRMEGGDTTEDNDDERREERRHKKQKQRQQRQHRHRNTSLPTSTPTGLLHKNPPVLPLQDRIAIAEYACHPTRVSDLISPLCVRLTTQFGQVEGMVRMLEEWDKDNSRIEGDNAIDDSASVSTSLTTAAVATTTDTRSSAPSYKISSTTATTASRDVNEQEERKKQQKINIRKQRRAAERARLCSAMQNLVANVQDELLLLDDFLKVGLISLSEQVIEMLLATFVYPMMLQPLLLPIHRYSSSRGKDMDAMVQQGKDVVAENDNDTNAALEEKNLSAIITIQSSAPFSSILCSTAFSADGGAATATASPNFTRTPQQDLAPAKTALYGLSLVIRTITNQTFRHLLLVALLHPLSPRPSGGQPVVRSRPQITLRRGSGGGRSRAAKPRREEKEKINDVSSNSRDDSIVEIRTDASQERQSVEYGEPLQFGANVYSFGTEDSNENNFDERSTNTTSFILAPGLVDILRHSCANQPKPSGDELTEEILSSGATMTRLNPYRQVLLSSISGSAEMVVLQPLATALIHAAVLSVGSSTIQRIIFSPMKDGENDSTPVAIATPRADDSSSMGSDSEEEILKCLCLSIVNTLVTYDGWWKVKFNTVAARTLMDVISNRPVYISFAKDLVGSIRHDAAKFLMAIPSQLDAKSREGEAESTDATPTTERRPSALVDKQYLDNWLIDRFFFDRAGKSTISVVENVRYIKECCEEDDALDERYRYGLEVLTAMSLTEACVLLCESTMVVDNMVVATESEFNTSFHCAASWALACLYLDAFHGKLMEMLCPVIDNDEEGGQQNAPPRRRLSYISSNRSRNDDDSMQEQEEVSSSLAPISSKFTIAMLDECESPSSSGRNNESSNDSTSMATPPEYGSAVGLVGRAAFPCVIEVTSPASSTLFTGRTCISNEGIRWQSLYLVVFGKWAIFAEPGSDGTSAAGGEGRVVASCKLACLSFRRDASSAANDKTNSARRVLVSHTSLDPRPPPLFVVDSSAASATSRRGGRGGGGSNLGPNGLRLTRSRMDLWFEDYHAGERARKVLSAKIAKARARRGERLSTALFTS